MVRGCAAGQTLGDVAHDSIFDKIHRKGPNLAASRTGVSNPLCFFLSNSVDVREWKTQESTGVFEHAYLDCLLDQERGISSLPYLIQYVHYKELYPDYSDIVGTY